MDNWLTPEEIIKSSLVDKDFWNQVFGPVIKDVSIKEDGTVEFVTEPCAKVMINGEPTIIWMKS